MTQTTAVTIEHYFNAAPSVVWRAWTEPDIVRRWWGSDPDGEVISAVLDVRAGGRFAITFRDSSGDQHTSSGEYLHVEANTELDFTWSWQSEPNNPSRVNVHFTEQMAGTHMRFVHGELRGMSQHDYAQGWRRTFAKLDGVLAKTR
jgi:uncharacterized protein YndB with AHSA1/START domain